MSPVWPTTGSSRGQTLLDLLDVDISGRTFKQAKPHPEIFLTACRELGDAPRSCFVVEDAVASVTSAKAGGMAALGIARLDDTQLLPTPALTSWSQPWTL